MTETTLYTIRVAPREQRDNILFSTVLESNHPDFQAGTQIQAESLTLAPRGQQDTLPVQIVNLDNNRSYTGTFLPGEGEDQQYQIAAGE